MNIYRKILKKSLIHLNKKIRAIENKQSKSIASLKDKIMENSNSFMENSHHPDVFFYSC